MTRLIQRIIHHIIICLALLLLTACGFFGAEAEPTPSPEPITLNYVTFGVLAVAENALIKQFESEHPAIKLDSQQFRQSPFEYLTATAPPDIMTIAPSVWLDQAIEQSLVTDITDLWQQAGFADSYPANLRTLSERNGKQYFLPIGYNWNAIYYNKAVFEQYNLQPPQ
ncbi:MAG: ABC transporter substrate-binding protein, partial [Chloroflexota bacterium]|nr:ABC transporter substrate-binding protein [Chloroflexota bacterium]